MWILTKKSGVFCKYLANGLAYRVRNFAKTYSSPVPTFPPSFAAIGRAVRPAIEDKQTHKQTHIPLYISRFSCRNWIAHSALKVFVAFWELLFQLKCFLVIIFQMSWSLSSLLTARAMSSLSSSADFAIVSISGSKNWFRFVLSCAFLSIPYLSLLCLVKAKCWHWLNGHF